MTDYKQLCAELVRIADALDSGTALASNQGQAMDGYSALAAFRDVAYRARAALTEPEPEGLTDEELLCIAAEAIDGYGNCGIKPGEYEEVTEQAVEAYGSELIAYARAVLARWGNHPAKPDTSLQPIPVSERDCRWFSISSIKSATPELKEKIKREQALFKARNTVWSLAEEVKKRGSRSNNAAAVIPHLQAALAALEADQSNEQS